MSETYWKEIKEFENQIANQNVELLIDFIKRLADLKLLTSHMLHHICESTVDTKGWIVLHEFVKKNENKI